MKTLVLVDIQNDFLPGGALAVPDGDVIVPIVNGLLPRLDLVVATQDWHPADHGSFAANHPGRAAFENIELNGLPQTLWPVHCVQNTGGACFAPGLDTRRVARVFPKGMDPRVDSYSGLFDNGRRSSPCGLNGSSDSGPATSGSGNAMRRVSTSTTRTSIRRRGADGRSSAADSRWNWRNCVGLPDRFHCEAGQTIFP